jgi:hypothetical protein
MPPIRVSIPGMKAGTGDYVQSVGRQRFVVGVDFATAHDFTAISVVEHFHAPAPHYGKGYVQ